MEFFLLILERTPHSSDYERRFLVILLPSAVFNREKRPKVTRRCVHTRNDPVLIELATELGGSVCA